jgi:hypothetical protein
MVLIDMEMPKRCEECKLNTAEAFGGLGCRATGYIPLRKSGQDKPSWCPLKPITQTQPQITTSIYDQEEVHHNCTVQVLRNSVTGETSVGWWEEKEKEE